MKRALFFLLILAVPVPPSGATPVNLIANPGFEKGAEGWNNWGGDITTSARSGGSALRISQETPKWSGCDQRILLAGGSVPAKAVLSGWMRTESVVKNKEAWEMARIVLNFYDAQGNMVGGYQASAGEAKDTTDWTRYEKSYGVPEGTRQIEVQCALGNCAGTAFFDDLVLEVSDASGRSVARGVMTGPADEGKFFEILPPEPGSAGHWADWSGLLEKPAGSHGRVTAAADGTLQFNDGTPARFWGTNLVAQNCFPEPKVAEATALRLSRMGCNLVRFHHMDAPWFQGNLFCNAANTRKICPESLEKLDYLIHCLEQRGIYVYLDLLVHREFKPADGVGNRPPDLGGKQAGLFSRKLIQLQKEYAKQLYEHVNPHTGKAYKDDPAVVGSEFINESSVFMHFDGDILTPPYREELEGMWKKAGHKTALARFSQDWIDVGGRMKESGTGGDVAKSIPFLADLEWGYFREMEETLRGLGVKSLLSGSNWSPCLATLYNDARLDMVINNNYWDHPQLWKIGNDWSRVMWAPLDNKSHIASFENNSVVSLSYARAAGKPFLVTEWNDCYPNEYRLEGVPLMAAYASLQGWGGFLQFDFGHDPMGSVTAGSFSVNNMPDHLAQWVVAAPMFLRGDVKTAPGSVVENVTKQQRWSLPSHSMFLKDNPWIPYVTRYAKSFDDARPAGASGVTAFAANYDAGAKVARSETGELTLDAGKGLFRVDTERLQGVEGALKGAEFGFKDMKVKVDNSFASVFLVSADGKNLATSDRMYLVATGLVKTTGLKYNENRKQLTDLGRPPLLGQVLEGWVLFKNPDPGVKVTVRPLSTGGTPGDALPVQVKPEGTVFFLDKGRTFVYSITVNRR